MSTPLDREEDVDILRVASDPRDLPRRDPPPGVLVRELEKGSYPARFICDRGEAGSRTDVDPDVHPVHLRSGAPLMCSRNPDYAGQNSNPSVLSVNGLQASLSREFRWPS